MARAASKVATKPRKKTVRAVRRGANMMPLMPLKGLTWDKAKLYTHYEVESKEWLETVKKYIRKHYDKKVSGAINKLPDWKVGGNSHWACTAYLLGTNPSLVPETYSVGFDKWVRKLAEEGAAVVEEKKAEEQSKKNVYVPTIQERITEQSQDACDAIEEWLEGYIVNPGTFDPKGFDFVAHFSNTKVTQAHARKIKKFYQGWLEEAELVANMPTAAQVNKIKNEHEADEANQLREGYAHVKKTDAKKWLEALENLMGACDVVIDASKATRKTRVKKAPSKEKVVAKLKYKDRDDKYQIVSVNPLDLIGATEIWVFNTKTRKLGKYVADEYTKTMTVKGSTIVGYDENKSVQKTIRKPEEILKEFKKAGKVKLRKFLEEINAVEVKLNGRMNTDTIILKALD